MPVFGKPVRSGFPQEQVRIPLPGLDRQGSSADIMSMSVKKRFFRGAAFGAALLILLLTASCSKELAEVSYYKNLPEISGTTRDEEPMFFIVKVELAYKWGDKKTQYSLAELKPVLIDGLRNLLCQKKAEDFSSRNEDLLKEEIVELVNRTLHRYDSFKNVPGIVTVALVKVQVFEFR